MTVEEITLEKMDARRGSFCPRYRWRIGCPKNITGTWQSSLKGRPRDLRIVIKKSLQDDKLNAVMYSIDQGGGNPARFLRALLP